MRLQSLHIKGFKSFANETTIHFHENVIGVVGPNGSGKSNVVDAIRWVLGEQKSKDLRLDQMVDVIFNGTKKRKESSSATVELTFINDKGILPSEYTQVSIARTLFRSGESEYRLNNVVCRLKDIRSLLVDTGIGSNSYAIIALGMVDDILEDKEDSRRRMFEQAAGISKFKTRKKETVQKLKLATDDLNRVDDLLFEIEGNMKNLEKQAKKTKKYFELKEEYKILAINSAVRSIQELKATYKNLNEEIQLKQDQYNQTQSDLTIIESQIQKEKKDILDKELALSSKQKELGQIISNIRTAESEKGLIEQSRNFKKQNIKNIEKLLTELEVQKIQLNNDIEILENNVLEEKSNTEKASLKLNEYQNKLNEVKKKFATLKNEEDTRLSNITLLQNEVFETEKNLAVITNQLENLKKEKDQSDNDLKILEVESHRVISLYENKLKEKSEADNLLKKVKLEESNQIESIKNLEKSRDEIQLRLSEINRNIDAKQNELDLLQSMIQSYEGFPESIRFLSQNWRKDVPVLSDLLDVEERYKPIIESYLEPYLNYFVVEDTSSAIKAIQILSGAQKGKANFFLLNELPQTPHPESKSNDYIPAVSVVNVDEKYRNLVNFLLKKTYIYSGNIDKITHTKIDSDTVILSENGSFFRSKIVLSGGALGLFEGKKIGRKKNLEKLEKVLEELKIEKDEITESFEKSNKLLDQLKNNDLRKSIDEATRNLAEINQELVRISIQRENIDKNKIEILDKVKINQQLIKDLNQKISDLKSSITQKNNHLEALKNPGDDQSKTLDEISIQLSKATEEFNDTNIKFIKQENILINVYKELEFKQLRLKDVSQRITIENNNIEREKEEYSTASEKLDVLDQSLVTLYKEKSGFQGLLSTTEQIYHQARVAITDLEEKAKALTRQSNQLQITLNQLKDKYNEVKYEISAVGDRLNIEFDVPINDIFKLTPDETLPREEEAEKANQLKFRIQNYGEINPLALEAYEEIKIRFDLITQQKQDILEAHESLKQTIKEIEDTAITQFMGAFEQIRTNFISVFRHLFTEDDTCDLVLVDANDPLESPIEIIAKPRGKKPKSLSQLSGGEKTLTATALLFSLYLLKPAPFCIFDEVDAPLDDANIQKFNNIIKNFSNNSQFIIVTHNKATMTAVDILYGVYMEELGVSSVTPVDFRALKDDRRFDGLG